MWQWPYSLDSWFALRYKKSNADTTRHFKGQLICGLGNMSDQPTTQHYCHYCLVLVSAPSEAEAKAIAQSLVQAKLAACASITPIQSIYRWQGQIHTEPEWQLTIKTTMESFDALQHRILTLHSYEVPEILAIPVQAGAAMYLRWIDDNVEPLEN
jgi:periplasmic divalent cation tolerance protein